jgi:hypothetical protein
MDSTFYSHRESEFKNQEILGSQRIEVENQRFQEVEELKSEIQEVKD